MLQQNAVVQQLQQLATLSVQKQAMQNNCEERLQQEQLGKIANSKRFSTSVAHLQGEIQILEYIKWRKKVDDHLWIILLPNIYGVSGSMSESTPLCGENAAARPTYQRISTPPQQR